MHPKTVATLAQLDQAPWFTHLGETDTTVAIVLSSWEESMTHCSSDEWQDLLLEAANRYCERLFERSKVRFNQWNTILAEIKRTTEPFVRRKIDPVVRNHALPPIFEQTVQWEILHLCMEAEYADVYPPGFFASHAYWYSKGHFPCGWQGAFPEGTLIIY